MNTFTIKGTDTRFFRCGGQVKIEGIPCARLPNLGHLWLKVEGTWPNFEGTLGADGAAMAILATRWISPCYSVLKTPKAVLKLFAGLCMLLYLDIVSCMLFTQKKKGAETAPLGELFGCP